MGLFCSHAKYERNTKPAALAYFPTEFVGCLDSAVSIYLCTHAIFALKFSCCGNIPVVL